MTTTHDPYATEAETDALLAADTRTPAERRLAALFDQHGGNEQGAEPEAVLRRIALELIEAQGAQPADRQVMQQALEALEEVSHTRGPRCKEYLAITALRAALAAPQPAQEPVHFRAVLDAEQVPQQLKTSMHVVGFRTWKAADEFVASERDMKGWRYTIEPLCICQHGITKGPAA